MPLHLQEHRLVVESVPAVKGLCCFIVFLCAHLDFASAALPGPVDDGVDQSSADPLSLSVVINDEFIDHRDWARVPQRGAHRGRDERDYLLIVFSHTHVAVREREHVLEAAFETRANFAMSEGFKLFHQPNNCRRVLGLCETDFHGNYFNTLLLVGILSISNNFLIKEEGSESYTIGVSSCRVESFMISVK